MFRKLRRKEEVDQCKTTIGKWLPTFWKWTGSRKLLLQANQRRQRVREWREINWEVGRPEGEQGFPEEDPGQCGGCPRPGGQAAWLASTSLRLYPPREGSGPPYFARGGCSNKVRIVEIQRRLNVHSTLTAHRGLYVSLLCCQVPVHPDQPNRQPEGRGLFRHREGHGHSVFGQVGTAVSSKVCKIAIKLEMIKPPFLQELCQGNLQCRWERGAGRGPG